MKIMMLFSNMPFLWSALITVPTESSNFFTMAETGKKKELPWVIFEGFHDGIPTMWALPPNQIWNSYLLIFEIVASSRQRRKENNKLLSKLRIFAPDVLPILFLLIQVLYTYFFQFYQSKRPFLELIELVKELLGILRYPQKCEEVLRFTTK